MNKPFRHLLAPVGITVLILFPVIVSAQSTPAAPSILGAVSATLVKADDQFLASFIQLFGKIHLFGNIYLGSTASSASQLATSSPWQEFILGGGGNNSGLDISPQGVRLVRSDGNGAYIWGADGRYHNLITAASMPAADFGLYPVTNTSDNQLWSGFRGVIELVGCPSSGSCAYMYGGGNMFYSGNISTTSPGTITWCALGGWTKTYDSENQVIGNNDPGQFMAVDPANPDHVIVGTPSTQPPTYTAGLYETFNGTACGATTWTAISTGTIPLSIRGGGNYPGYAIAFDPTGGTHSCNGGASTCSAKAYVFTAGQYATGVTINTAGSGYGNNVTGGTLTYNTNCGVSLVLTVNTDSSGAISAITGFTPGMCSPLPSSSYASWTPGGGLTTPNTPATFNVSGTSPGVYATTDGGNTWTETSGGPTTVQHIKVSPATAGGGNVWATDASFNLWELQGSTWTKITSVNGKAVDVAINPNNGDHVVVGGGSGMSVSTNGSSASPTFTFYSSNVAPLAGTTPWESTIVVNGSGGGVHAIAFDPLQTDTLVASLGQSMWTTSLPNGTFSWTGQANGIYGLDNEQLAVSAYGTPTVTAQDESGCRFSISTAGSSPASCMPMSQMLDLSMGYGMSVVPGHDFTLIKGGTGPGFAGGLDTSGYSTDGFGSSYLPFNRWNATIVGSTNTIANNGSGAVRVTLPSTSGLTTFAPGQSLSDNSIVCVFNNSSFGQNFGLGNGNCYPITVVDGTHIDLIGSTFNSKQQAAGTFTLNGVATGNYIFWVPAEAFDDAWGENTIVNVTDDAANGNLVTIKVDNTGLMGGNNSPVCISGVTMSGTTVVNGCWTTSHVTGSYGSQTFDLVGSSFSNGDTYTTGGDVLTWGNPGGSIAGSTLTNWTSVGGDRTFPLCTTDAGADWSQVRMPDNSDLSYTVTNAGGTVPAGSTTMTMSGTASGIFHVILTSGRWFYLNGTNNGTTLTFAPAVPPGDSIPANAKLYSDSGWTFAAYLYGSVVAADQVTPNTFYGVNFYAGLMKWTNCGTPVSIANINNSGWTADGNFNSTLKAVPGEAGHLFFTVGPVGSGGSAQPASSRLWRMCNASSAGANGATWQSVPGMYEPVAFGFGAPAPGKNYPTEYVVGWYDTSVNTGGNGSINNAQYGIWESTDDPNHGVTSTCDVTAGHQTWTNIGASQNAVNGLPLGWYTNVNDISGDPFVHGPVYFAGGFGMFYGIFP